MNAPQRILEMLATSALQSVRDSVAQNPATPAAVLAELAYDSSGEVGNHAVKNRSLPASYLTGMIGASHATDQAIGKREDATLETLLALAERGHPDSIMTLACRRDAPGELLTAVLERNLPVSRERVAAHKNTPADVLVLLAVDSVPIVRHAALRNPSMPPAVLDARARTASDTATIAIENPSVPSDTLRGLADLGSSGLRSKIAVSDAIMRNEFAPSDVIEKLFKRGPATANQVGLHPNTPGGILLGLARNSSDTDVALASNVATPAEALTIIARRASREPSVRRHLAGNPSTPVGVLADLARSAAHEVQEAVASNPSTPPAVVDSLSRVGSRDLHLAVLENPALSDGQAGRMHQDALCSSAATEVHHCVLVRISKRLDVRADNTKALEAIADLTWWDMSTDSPEIALALAIHGNL